jgi:hypothetical protein
MGAAICVLDHPDRRYPGGVAAGSQIVGTLEQRSFKVI